MLNTDQVVLHFEVTHVKVKPIITPAQLKEEIGHQADMLKIDFCDEYEECWVI